METPSENETKAPEESIDNAGGVPSKPTPDYKLVQDQMAEIEANAEAAGDPEDSKTDPAEATVSDAIDDARPDEPAPGGEPGNVLATEGCGGMESEEGRKMRLADEAAERELFPRQTVAISIEGDDRDLGCVVERYDGNNDRMMLEARTTIRVEVGRDDCVHIFPVYGPSGEHFHKECAKSKG